MFIFNEGVPRSGKSHDVMKFHILPALKAGRMVYARVNGLDSQPHRDAIAEYVGQSKEYVDAHLVHVATKDVKEFFTAEKNEEGEWVIPDHFKDALCVIDEIHQFYVASRTPLPAEVEEFFALLGQNGGDAVIMTQMYSRLHPAVRGRIEKKNTFQKLEAVGMEGKYLITYYQTIRPDKYEKLASETMSYDAKVFPTYKGYADGSTNREVYKAGSTNVWKGMAFKASLFAIAGVIGVVTLMSFFGGDGGGLAKESKTALINETGGAYSQPSTQAPIPQREQAQAVRETITQRKERQREEQLSKMTPEQRYVIELADLGRVRLAGRMGVGSRSVFMVEWLTDAGVTVERLSGAALKEMGFTVVERVSSVVLTAGSEAVVATAWPLTMSVRGAESELYNTSGSEPPVAPTTPSAASRGGAAGGEGEASSVVPAYGGIAR